MTSDHCGVSGAPHWCRGLIPSTVEVARTFVETLALERIKVHSGVMSNSGGGPFYWCLRHSRVETDANLCPAARTMGPYETRSDAEQALRRVAERNEQLDAEDARWSGKTP